MFNFGFVRIGRRNNSFVKSDGSIQWVNLSRTQGEFEISVRSKVACRGDFGSGSQQIAVVKCIKVTECPCQKYGHEVNSVDIHADYVLTLIMDIGIFRIRSTTSLVKKQREARPNRVGRVAMD